MKLYYFPNSSSLADYWFHRLIYPLYNVCVILYIVGVIVYVCITAFGLIKTSHNANNSSALRPKWCDKYLEGKKADSAYTFYSSLNSYQESLLINLPKEKAKTYAHYMGGCLYESKIDDRRAWVSSINSEIYMLSNSNKPGEIIKEQLMVYAILVSGYIFGAIVPGVVYKYILYVSFGKKLQDITK